MPYTSMLYAANIAALFLAAFIIFFLLQEKSPSFHGLGLREICKSLYTSALYCSFVNYALNNSHEKITNP